MKRILLPLMFALAASLAAGQSRIPEAVREMVNEGARHYRAGRFAEAQEHFERALAQAPGSETLALFVARAVQQQYKPGVETPENRAQGAKAIAAYERLLALDPASDDAYKAIVFLHGQMGNEEKVREVLTARAHNPAVTDDRRAEAFVILASREWKCSYDITEQKENKHTTMRGARAVLRYRMPRVRADFERARRCAQAGLDLAEQAERLAPDNPTVFSYKANLLREAAKLAEMEGDRRQQGEYDQRFEEAVEAHKRLSEERAWEKDAEGPRPANPDDPF